MAARRKLKNGNGKHSNGNGNHTKTTRRRPGRPGVYGPDKVIAALEAMKLGATELQLARILGVSIDTITEWKNTHEEFSAALKLGKEAPDRNVERSLYNRAVGYTFASEKVFYNAKTGEVERVPIMEHVPPDVTAQIFWLKNRDAANWRENHNQNSGEADVPVQEAQIQLLARVFGVISRLSGGEAKTITAGAIEVKQG